MTLGERVRELRKAKGLTLRALAEKVQVNFTYLSKIENAKLDFGEAAHDHERGQEPDYLEILGKLLSVPSPARQQQRRPSPAAARRCSTTGRSRPKSRQRVGP
jgi:hypothetical protein